MRGVSLRVVAGGPRLL